ncbi:MAG: hypothetical protein ATN31_00600 [Candidatus Epulonipiscioides saccharophilum]|nr:MAG: hypothetical protein ATN31_00600 [Epulopiscium sp. AS2M-Bin001]
MKKFIIASLIGAMALTNINVVMAAAPAPAATAPAALKYIDFAPISFEATEPVLWTSGATATGLTEVIKNADGTQALKIGINSRATDWKLLTTSTLNPPKGSLWSLTKYDVLKATVTNPHNFDTELRINISDNIGNTRLCIFKIPANSTKDIAVDKVHWGEPGVASSNWDLGYSQKGIDPSQIKAIRFYAAEPTATVMEGQTSMSFIIDNVRVEKGVVPSGTSFVINGVKPAANGTGPAFAPLVKANYEAVLGKTLLGGNPPAFPNSMTLQLKKDGKHLPADSKGIVSVPAGEAVTLHLQMFKSYQLKGNVGNTNLDVTVTSPKGIKILTTTQSQPFVDAKEIGTLSGLNFDFIMPEGNVDILNDFKWDFKLTPQ